MGQIPRNFRRWAPLLMTKEAHSKIRPSPRQRHRSFQSHSRLAFSALLTAFPPRIYPGQPAKAPSPLSSPPPPTSSTPLPQWRRHPHPSRSPPPRCPRGSVPERCRRERAGGSSRGAGGWWCAPRSGRSSCRRSAQP
jgi:hypothetical protein